MRKYYLWLLAGASSIASAQGIVGMEYWFDNDISNKKYESVADSSANIKIGIANLGEGIHSFHLRGINASGTPGILSSEILFIPPSHKSNVPSLAEIWIDSKKSKTIPISSDKTGQFELDIADLENGLHFLTILPITKDGESGHTYRHIFYKNNIAETERKQTGYITWFDNDCQSMQHHSLTDGEEKLNLDISELNSGLHTFSILPLCDDNNPGQLYTTLFYIPKIEYPVIEAYRYWFDDDEENAVECGQSATPLHLKLDVASLASGQHFFHIMARGEKNEWGDIHTVGFEMPVDLDLADWQLIQKLHGELTALGWDSPWDMDKGPAAASKFQGVTSQEGHVTQLALSDIGVEGSFPQTALAFPKLVRLDLSDNKLTGKLDSIGQSASRNQTLEYADLSHNKLSGDLSKFAERFTGLKALDVSHNSIPEISAPLPESIDNLNIQGQRLSDTAELDISNLSEENIISYVPTIFRYNPLTREYDNNPDLLLSAAELENFNWSSQNLWWGELTAEEGEYSITDISPDNVFTGTGEGLTLIKKSGDKTSEWTSMPARINFEKGDANFSNGLTIADLQSTILYILSDYGHRPFNFTAADTHTDNIINVLDAVETVNLLLQKETVRKPQKLTAASAIPDNADISIYIQGDEILLQSAEDIGAVMISYTGDAEWYFDRYGISQSANSGSIIAYSVVGQYIPAGTHLIGKATGNMSIGKAEACSSDAYDLAICVNDASTGVGLHIGEDPDEIFFKPDGTRTGKPTDGITIKISKGKASKIITK